jgi:fatty-acyl-CoA synthase
VSTPTPRLLDVFNDLVRTSPDEVVLYDAHAGTRPAVPVTRIELASRAGLMAADLRGLGMGDGDCVAVWLPNWSHAVAVQLAALTLGVQVIGINTRYNIDEVAHVLATAQPSAVVIAHDFMGLDLLGRLRDAHAATGGPAPTVLVVSAPGIPSPPDVAAYDLGDGAATFPVAREGLRLTPPPVPGLATAFTTSGSTGRAKLAAHREVGITEHALAVGRGIGLDTHHVMLGALPLSGVFGFTATITAVLAGARVLLEPVFDAHGVLDDMVRYHVTHVVGADDLVGNIERAWRHDRPQLSLEWIGIADFEGRSKELAQWAEEEIGASVAGVYGSSELFALTAFWPDRHETGLRWTGGGKVVMPSIRVRVADPATGDVLAVGAAGELQFRGPNVVDEYLGDPTVAASAFSEDGWFRSGDLGRMIENDTFQFICRMGDALRLRGFLVDPSEIELRLSAHPGVMSTKVVGVTSAAGGTVAVAFVVHHPGQSPDEDELRRWCTQSLAKFKVPDRVLFIDEMPTTSGTNGTKIRAVALRELAAKELKHA